MIDNLKRFGTWLLGLLAAAGAVLFALNRYQSKRLVNEAEKAHSEADKLRLDAAVEAEKQRQRVREAEANAKDVAELNKRLERLRKKHGMLPFVLIGLLLVGLAAGSVRASDSPALPSDYASLAKLYFAALDRLAELRSDLEEAISIADGYRQAYETEARLREEAEAAVSRGLEREKQLQEVIDKQHAIILQLAGGKKNLSLMGGAVWFPSDPLRPGVLVAAGVNF